MAQQSPQFRPSFVKKYNYMTSGSLAKNLLYQRKLKGYTQEELADRTEVAIRTIQRIEKGQVTPHLKTVKLLAEALSIEVDDLLELENPKEEVLESKWLLLIHSTPVLGLVIPLCNVLFPLFLWIHKRGDNPLYEEHGRKVVNFQITMTILFLLSLIALVTIEGWGFFMFISVLPFTVIVSLINIVSALNKQTCFYPLSIPFIREKKDMQIVGLLLLVLMSLGACRSSAQSNNEVQRLNGSKISSAMLTQKIEHLMGQGKVQGLAVSIFNGNAVRYQNTFGYKNAVKKEKLEANTNMYGASFSKAVFAVLVMKLVDEGVIDLDTPLESYLPKKIYEYEPETRWHDDFSALKQDSLYHKITARMCLAHTTGFANYRFFEADQQLRVNLEPGTRYGYSGEGFIYLQVVLEKLLGKNLEALAQEKIFKPLGMMRSAYKWYSDFESNHAIGHNSDGKLYTKDKDNEPRGGGTLETTSSDYTKFLEAVLQGKILSPASWQEIFSPQIRIRSIRQFGPLSLRDSTANDAIALSYGLGWGVFQSPHGPGVFKEGHGDGFQNYSILFPEVGIGMMIMSNSDNAESIYKYLLEIGIGDNWTPLEWEGYVPWDEQ